MLKSAKHTTIEIQKYRIKNNLIENSNILDINIDYNDYNYKLNLLSIALANQVLYKFMLLYYRIVY